MGQTVVHPAQPPEPPRTSWTHAYAVPLFVASLIFLILVVVAGVVVLANEERLVGALSGTPGSTGPGADGTSPPSAPDRDGDADDDADSDDADDDGADDDDTIDADIDECVVGTWLTVEHVEDLAIAGLGAGEVSLIGEGPVVVLNADGSGSTDYGSRTEFRGSLAGFPLQVIAEGSVTFRYTTVSGVMRVSDVESDATAEFRYLGLSETDEMTLEEEDTAYECSGDLMIQQRRGGLPDESQFTTRYQRVAG